MVVTRSRMKAPLPSLERSPLDEAPMSSPPAESPQASTNTLQASGSTSSTAMNLPTLTPDMPLDAVPSVDSSSQGSPRQLGEVVSGAREVESTLIPAIHSCSISSPDTDDEVSHGVTCLSPPARRSDCRITDESSGWKILLEAEREIIMVHEDGISIQRWRREDFKAAVTCPCIDKACEDLILCGKFARFATKGHGYCVHCGDLGDQYGAFRCKATLQEHLKKCTAQK